jgi:hypothetical protein
MRRALRGIAWGTTLVSDGVRTITETAATIESGRPSAEKADALIDERVDDGILPL